MFEEKGKEEKTMTVKEEKLSIESKKKIEEKTLEKRRRIKKKERERRINVQCHEVSLAF